MAALILSVIASSAAAGVPVPNARQLDFMSLECVPSFGRSGCCSDTALRLRLTQFMHFGIPTFWDPPVDYLYGANPTYHDCHTTSIDHGPQ